MGTNYYIINGRSCEKCGGSGRADLHIGKSSPGWKFAFTTYKKTFLDWIQHLAINNHITDQYDNKVSLIDFLNIIKKGSKGSIDRENDSHWEEDLCRFTDGDWC